MLNVLAMKQNISVKACEQTPEKQADGTEGLFAEAMHSTRAKAAKKGEGAERPAQDDPMRQKAEPEDDGAMTTVLFAPVPLLAAFAAEEAAGSAPQSAVPAPDAAAQGKMIAPAQFEPAAETAEIIPPKAGAAEELPRTENNPFVSILEGKTQDKDITPPLPESTSPEAPPEGGRAHGRAANAGEGVTTARMPQQQTEAMDRQQARPENISAVKAPAASGDPCPLENGNEESTGEKKQGGAFPARELPTYGAVDISPERLAAESAAPSEKAAGPVTAERLFDELVERFEVSSAQDAKQMQIQLKPEHLGKVEIELTLAEGGLRAKIRVEDPGVKHLIEGQIARLSESLSEKGIKVAQLDVVYTSVSDREFSRQPRQEQQSARQNRLRGARVEQAVGLADALYPPQWGEALPGGADGALNSVEYRA